MAETIGKLRRSALAHYLNAAFTDSDAEAQWYLIGKDVEDMSIELNPQTETKKNILDETSVEDSGYEPATDVDTYFAEPDDTTPGGAAFYQKIKDIAMNRLTGSACRTRILEFLVDSAAGPYEAWTEDVIIKPQSYGGAQGGVRIPYSIAFCGNRQKGTVTLNDRVPTFTADTAGE